MMWLARAKSADWTSKGRSEQQRRDQNEKKSLMKSPKNQQSNVPFAIVPKHLFRSRALPWSPQALFREPKGFVLESANLDLKPTSNVFGIHRHCFCTGAALEQTNVVLKSATALLEPTGSVLESTGAVVKSTNDFSEPQGICLEYTSLAGGMC